MWQKGNMLIEEALQIVHLISQGDIDYPTSGDDEFALNLAALNALINHWETQKGISWNELYWNETGTIATNDADYTLDTDVKWPAGLLTIDGSPINYEKPEESHLTQAIGSIAKRFYLSGPVSQKMLEVRPTPDANLNGKTWVLPCYHIATRFSTGVETTPIQMSDPYYAIHGAVALINVVNNPTLAGLHQQISNEKLDAMRIANEAKPIGSTENHYDQTYSGFGT